MKHFLGATGLLFASFLVGCGGSNVDSSLPGVGTADTSRVIESKHSSGSFAEYPLQTAAAGPISIAPGADGNVWFAESQANQIGSITPAGNITEFAIPVPGEPQVVTLGPDGNVWFTQSRGSGQGYIGSISPEGAFSMHALPTLGAPVGITAGADGNLWYVNKDTNVIGRFSLSGSFKEFPVPTQQSGLRGITSGTGGTVWFTEQTANQIGKMTSDEKIAEYPIPTANSNPGRWITDVRGEIWFTELNSTPPAPARIARITSSGHVTEISVPDQPAGIVGGSDGRIWFDMQNIGAIGSLNSAGNQLSSNAIPTPNSDPLGMTVGPDGNIWFVEINANQIGVFTP